jgi:hypothetical protein
MTGTNVPTSTRGISATELVDAAGVTYRKVDYWTRIGYLETLGETTPGSGYGRRYADTEVDVARALKILVPLSGGVNGDHTFRVESVAQWIRMGLRGRVPLIPGVEVDLDVLCGE